MGRTFARGRHAIGICDRCGFQFPYRKLKREAGTGLMVDAECNDVRWNRVDHPQNFPPRDLEDAQGLRNPRPDEAETHNYLTDQNGNLILDQSGNPIHV